MKSHLSLRDQYSLRGVAVVLMAFMAATGFVMAVALVLKYPRAWWFGLLLALPMPFLVFLPSLPQGLAFWGNRQRIPAALVALSALLLMTLSLGLLEKSPPGMFRAVFALTAVGHGVVVGEFLYRVAFYSLIHWTLVTGRLRGYIEAMRGRHPVGLVLQQAHEQARDLTAEERLILETHVANVLLESATHDVPPPVARIRAGRARAVSRWLEHEAAIANHAVEYLRAARIRNAETRFTNQKGEQP